MHESFCNILVPIDLTANTELALKRALQLADSASTIHLLHVHHPQAPRLMAGVEKFFGFHSGSCEHEAVQAKLHEWKGMIEDSARDVAVCTWIEFGNAIQKSIEKKAREIDADLIIIGKTSNHPFFPFLNTVIPNEIVRNTGISVFTVKPGSMSNKIRKVVVPIAGEGPGNKLNAVSTICRKFRARVYLVTFMNNKNEPSDFYPSHLLQAYQFLKSSNCTQVIYEVLHGSNKAEALVHYAEKIDADLLLVHPETETKIGWMNKHISDVLPRDSRIQILAVNPAKSLH